VLAPGEPHDEILRPLYDAARTALPDGTSWFDAHTHIGENDPDGMTGTPAQLLAGLDRAGQQRALVFPMEEPGGYPPANDAVIAAAQASGGRLVALARLDPNADPLPEARRCLDAGVAGFKLHPRSDRFSLPHPEVERIVALAGEAGKIVLFHAGRGIPRLGQAAIDMARANPGARIVLAHAGISDLGWLEGPAAALDNLFFDTAWWLVWDILDLFARIPPGRILYASDMPYGTGLMHGTTFLRTALASGHGGATLAAMAGGQLGRLVDGLEPLDLGPPPGHPPEPTELQLPLQRVVAYLTAAAQLSFRGGDPTEVLSLARLAVQGPHDHDVLHAIDRLIARCEDERAAAVTSPAPTTDADGQALPPRAQRRAGVYPLMAAQLIAGTPRVPLPSNLL
jgi:uncharacterized protein